MLFLFLLRSFLNQYHEKTALSAKIIKNICFTLNFDQKYLEFYVAVAVISAFCSCFNGQPEAGSCFYKINHQQTLWHSKSRCIMIMAFAIYLAKCIYSSYQILLYLNHFSLITYTSLRIYALSAPLIFVVLRKNQSIQDTQPDQTKPDNCYNFFFFGV